MSTITPQISIIIPVYNVEDYIADCLLSVMKLSDSISAECIIVDDCGQDKSMEIARDIVDSYNGPILFRFVHHKFNKGLSAARNTGIKMSRGNYLFFMDSDDYIDSDEFGKIVLYACQYNADIIIGDYKEVGINTIEKLNDRKIPTKKGTIYTGQAFFINYHRPLSSVVWRNLYKRSFLQNNNIYFHEGIYFEDIEFTPTIFHYASSVIYSGVSYYYYRRRENSITTSSFSEKKLLDTIKIWNCLNELAIITPNKKLKSIYIRYGMHMFLKQYVCGEKFNHNRYIKMVKSYPVYEVRIFKIWLVWTLFKYLPPKIFIAIFKRRYCP